MKRAELSLTIVPIVKVNFLKGLCQIYFMSAMFQSLKYLNYILSKVRSTAFEHKAELRKILL